MSVYSYIIDAGHGSIKNGAYTTSGKMFIFPDGFTIYEGVINRGIAKWLKRGLIKEGIDFSVVYHEIEDTSLVSRVNLANSIYLKDKRAIYLSIHSNSSAAPNIGLGKGFEIFTYFGQSNSDKVADIFGTTYKKFFPEFPFRAETSDGDLDKEANLYVLRETKCPALLVENLFFDNREEAEYLASEKGQQTIANCLLACIKEMERVKPI